jgi:hypothetical protein
MSGGQVRNSPIIHKFLLLVVLVYCCSAVDSKAVELSIARKEKLFQTLTNSQANDLFKRRALQELGQCANSDPKIPGLLVSLTRENWADFYQRELTEGIA